MGRCFKNNLLNTYLNCKGNETFSLHYLTIIAIEDCSRLQAIVRMVLSLPIFFSNTEICFDKIKYFYTYLIEGTQICSQKSLNYLYNLILLSITQTTL